MGAVTSPRSFGVKRIIANMIRLCSIMSRWRCITPLGRPVVPLVYIMP